MLWSIDRFDYNEETISSGKKKQILVLRLNKSGVAQDIEESLKNETEFEIFYMPPYILKACARSILSHLISHNNYIIDDEIASISKREYNAFLEQAWKAISRFKNFDAVISVNFGYYPEREFAAALEKLGTPFIVLHKENLNGISKKRKDFWKRVYEQRRGPFSGRKILVYNEIERDLQVSSGIAPSEKIEIIGMPRLDRIHRWRRENAKSEKSQGAKHILFFAFGRVDKMPAIRRKLRGNAPDPMDQEWQDMNWSHLCEKTHTAIVRLAKRRPDLQVMIKTKGRSGQQREIMEMLSAEENSLPANLEIVSGGDPFELIADASVVIGFNTTAIIEALAAGKRVVVPWFGEVLEADAKDLVIDLGHAVDYATSPDELIEMVIDRANHYTVPDHDLSADVRQTLRYLVGNADGRAGQRALSALKRELASTENK